jgi:hypothetical protein
MISTHDLQKMDMYWFSCVHQELNDLYDSLLFAKNRGYMGNYSTKIVDHGILLPEYGIEW